MFFYMLFEKKRFWFVLLAPLSVLLTVLAHRRPDITERVFSMGIYRVFTETYGRVFGYLPFSVIQFLIILFPVAVIIYVICEIWNICTNTTKIGFNFARRKVHVVRLVANTACAIGVLLFMFTIFAGLNYARLEFGEVIGLEVRPSSVDELISLSNILAQQASEFSTQVSRDENGEMILSASHFVTAQEARVIFRGASENYPVLAGFVPLVKPILYSHFMSRLRITGVYAPFTMEAHVNVHVPDYHIPAIMVHELAHFRGIMREDEANFIAWLVSIYSDDIDFMYSGAMLAFVYTSNQLHRASPADWQRIRGSLSENVITDLVANQEYWRQFEGALAEISTAANDTYLRANRQEDGVASYGRMVDLLLAYFR